MHSAKNEQASLISPTQNRLDTCTCSKVGASVAQHTSPMLSESDKQPATISPTPASGKELAMLSHMMTHALQPITTTKTSRNSVFIRLCVTSGPIQGKPGGYEKTFRQFHYEGAEPIATFGDVRRVLYRLPGTNQSQYRRACIHP